MIIRARHDKNDPYFRFRRATAQDARLSWAARGVLAYLFSKPDDWEINPRALISEGDLGRDALYRVLSELKEFGYIRRYQERRSDGVLGRWVTDVYETPQLDKIGTPLPDLPDTVEPLPVQPYPAQPYPVNPEHTYKRKVHIREFTKKQQQHISEVEERGDKMAAAAAQKLDKETPASRFSIDQIEAFIRATKPHKTEAQVGGLARHLQRSGEEDRQIAEWLTAKARARARAAHATDCELCQGTGWQLIEGKGARPCPNL